MPMRMQGSGTVLAIAMAASIAMAGLDVVPDTVNANAARGTRAFDTVSLVNRSPGSIRVDSILIRFLDGNKPGDFIACKGCAPESIGAYVYNGWLYGPGSNQSLRYLRDSLFLLQDAHGAPVSVTVGGTPSPFALYFPINCPFCDRPAAYPAAAHYAYAFIGDDGSRADLTVSVGPTSGVFRREIPPLPAHHAKARDAAGKISYRASGPSFHR